MIADIIAILAIVGLTIIFIIDYVQQYLAYKGKIAYRTGYARKPSFWNLLASEVVMCLTVVLAYIFAALCILVVTTGSDSFTHYEKDSEWTIYALNDSSDVKGRFFLGTGSIESNLYYYYIRDTAHGQKIEKVSTSDAYLKYDDRCYVERYSRYYNDDLKTKLLVTRFFDKCDYNSYYVIHIPEGSITNEFVVDLQ